MALFPTSVAKAFLIAVVTATGYSAAASAETGYAQVISNEPARCAPDKGPAVRLKIVGLRSGDGNMFVRIYRARSRDWLKSKRYLTRVDAVPRKGSMVVCVPVAEPGHYAVAVQHDINGNRETDFSTDGAGMSNNPEIGSFLGIPRPPSVSKAAFRIAAGVRRMTVIVRYRN